MNILAKTVHSTQFKALFTLMLLCLAPAFFIQIKKEKVTFVADKTFAKSSFFSVDDTTLYQWQTRLIHWTEFANPLIFTSKVEKMGFTPQSLKQHLANKPLPQVQMETLQKSLDSSTTLPLTFLPTPSLSLALQQTFDGFSVTTKILSEKRPALPSGTVLRDLSGVAVRLIENFDRDLPKLSTPPTQSSLIEITSLNSSFPRVIIKKTSGNNALDNFAIKKISTNLLSSNNREKWQAKFGDTPKILLEVEWNLGVEQ